MAVKYLCKQKVQASEDSVQSDSLTRKIRTETLRLLYCFVFVRLVTEPFQSLAISSIYELKEFDSSKSEYVISGLIAIIILMALFAVLGVLTFNFIANFNVSIPNRNRLIFKPLYFELKDSKWARLFPLLLLTKRFVYVIILVALSSSGLDFKYVTIILLQVLYTGHLAAVRPFKIAFLNGLEIVNECMFILYLIVFYALDSSDSWSNGSQILIICTMSLHIIIAVILSLCK